MLENYVAQAREGGMSRVRTTSCTTPQPGEYFSRLILEVEKLELQNGKAGCETARDDLLAVAGRVQYDIQLRTSTQL